MKSIWNGSISFGLVNIPVKLYSAVESKSFSFRMLDKIKIEKSSADEFPADAFAVKPAYVDEVKYQEITKDKKLRAPVFLRLRDDKKPEECVLEAN